MKYIKKMIKNGIEKIHNALDSHLISKIIVLSLPCFYIDNGKSLSLIREFVFYSLLWIVSIYVLIDFFFIKRKKITKIMFFFLLYYAWVIFRQLKEGLTLNDLHLSISACVLIFIIETYIKDNPYELLSSFMCIFEVYIYINAISIVSKFLIRNSKMEDFFLVGNRNVFAPYAIAAIVVGILYTKNSNNFKRGSLLCATSLISMLIIKSTTALLCSLIIIIIYSLFIFIINTKQIKIKLMCVAIFVLFLNILLFIYAYNVDASTLFGSIISFVFHKSPHLSARTDIWIRSIEMIKEKLLFGYGDEVMIVCFVNNGLFIKMGQFLQPHNALLRIQMQFGLIGTVLFSMFSFVYIREIDKCKDSIYKNLIICTFFSLYIYCIMEVCGIFYLFYIMVFLSCHLDDIPDYDNNKSHGQEKTTIIQ